MPEDTNDGEFGDYSADMGTSDDEDSDDDDDEEDSDEGTCTYYIPTTGLLRVGVCIKLYFNISCHV